jgi:glycine/D-amino acid oxidase-like deaminating enzyme
MSDTRVVILGGGIMGLTTAFYLLQSNAKVTLIESHAIAHGASSRAMGMIGRDWQSTSTKQLAQLSWKLYQEFPNMLQVTGAIGVQVESGAKLSRYRDLPNGEKSENDIFNGEVYTMGSSGVGHV